MNPANDQSASGWFNSLEETLIAVLMAAMTLITFANVIERYFFNSNILWALEVTVFLFAWMVLLGASYLVKHNLHIGVDVVVNLLSTPTRRLATLFAGLACIAYAGLLLKGSWDYWYPFATSRAFMETSDIAMPGYLQFVADWINDGERYEKLPRVVPYLVLPLSMALLLWRFIEVTIRVWRGEQALIIAGHEAEEMVADAEIQTAESAFGRT